ncbi:MAG: hypothetical protein K2X38_02895 [Gemmataceae bacterium]|nr:hypothetical protein [Gemmataceae bacterium]
MGKILFRRTIMCQLVDCLTNRIVATFLIAAALGGAAWGAYEWAKPRTPAVAEIAKSEEAAPDPKAEPKAKPKSEHPPITALRERMLAEFHGVAGNTFASMPGFGIERMTPLYKKVPFEVPYFSTGDLEAAEGPKKTPELLEEALAKTHQQFEKLTPAPAIKKDAPRPFFAGNKGWGGSFNNTIAHGLQLRLLDLVGLTDQESPKVFVGGQAFELARLELGEIKELDANLKKLAGKDASHFGFFGRHLDAKISAQLGIRNDGWMTFVEATSNAPMATRNLDMFETAGVHELLTGKDVYIRTKDHVVRMLGALRAADQCIRCHTEAKAGDLLGAFSYAFVDGEGAIRRSMKK